MIPKQIPKIGAGCLIQFNYFNKVKNTLTPVIVLGQETGGKYAGMFSLPAGKFESKDGFLMNGQPNLFNTACRETTEELGGVIDAKCFGVPRAPDLVVGQTPLWNIASQKGLSRKSFRATKEMSSMEFVTLDSVFALAKLYAKIPVPYGIDFVCLTVDGKYVRVSRFVVCAIKELYKL